MISKMKYGLNSTVSTKFSNRRMFIISAMLILVCIFIAGIFYCMEYKADAAEQGATENSKDALFAVDSVIEPKASSGKILVAYFSAQGHTKNVAQTIATATNADLFEIVPQQAYSEDDLNYNDSNSRVSREHNDESLRDIALTTTTPANWSSYDTVFVGYPIWWGGAAWPINNFIKGNDFTGKTVIPFATSVSSGMGQSATTLQQMTNTGTWQAGQRFSSSASAATVQEWVNSLDFGQKTNISTTTVSGIEASYEETGSGITPEPVVTDISVDPAVTLAKGTDYTLAYSDNVAVGTGKVIITGIGSWTGTKEVSFVITAKTTPTPTPTVETSWNRLAGGTAFGTMKQVVNKGWKTSEYAIIATSTGYQDALAASALAGLLDNAPVLLTTPTALHKNTSALLTSLGVKKAVIVGGTAAVSDGVKAEIQAMNIDVTRVAGGTAVGTSNEVYKYGTKLTNTWGKDAIVATIDSYQDALSIASYAYAKKAPIFLTSAGKKTIATSVQNNLKAGGFTRTLITGGTGAVDKSVEGVVPGAKRLSSGTSYGTSRVIAEFCVKEGMTTANMGVACGTSYQDALVGAALLGKNNSVIILADDSNSSSINKFIKAQKANIGEAYVFGGKTAVSDKIMDALNEAIK